MQSQFANQCHLSLVGELSARSNKGWDPLKLVQLNNLKVVEYSFVCQTRMSLSQIYHRELPTGRLYQQVYCHPIV